MKLKSGRIVEVPKDRREFANGTVCTVEEGKTRQSELDGSDVNKIVARMGGMPPRPVFTPEQIDALYVDVGNIGSYREAISEVDRVRTQFDALPADARLSFQNDPVNLLDAIDRQDRGALEKAGLVKPEPVAPIPPAPVPVPVVVPAAGIKAAG